MHTLSSPMMTYLEGCIRNLQREGPLEEAQHLELTRMQAAKKTWFKFTEDGYNYTKVFYPMRRNVDQWVMESLDFTNATAPTPAPRARYTGA